MSIYSRTRVLKHQLQFADYHEVISGNHPNITPIDNSIEASVKVLEVSDVMSDVVTKRYWTRVHQGEIILNPLERVQRKYMAEYTPYIGTYTDDFGYFIHTISHPSFIGSLVSETTKTNKPLVEENLDDLAYMEALAKVDKSNYAFMEDIAEFHKTINTIKSIFTKTSALHRVFDRRTEAIRNEYKIKSGKDAVEAQAQAWLEMRYAFRPILISLQNLAKQLNESVKPRLPIDTARSTKTSEFSTTTTSSFITASQVSYTITVVETITKKVTVGVIYTNQHASNLESFFGLRPRDIPKTMWAVMPYSWVFDHFINISKFIDASVSAIDPGIKYLGVWKVEDIEIKKQTIRSSVSYTGTDTNTSVSGGDCYIEEVSNYKTRSILDKRFPILRLSPAVHLRIDIAFVYDLLSLLIGRKALKDRY